MGALIVLIDVVLFQLPQVSSRKDRAGSERVLPSMVKNIGIFYVHPYLYSCRASLRNLFNSGILLHRLRIIKKQ